MFKKFTFVAFGRIASIAVALVLLTAAPAAQAGLLKAIAEAGAKAAAEDAAKAGARGAEITASGVSIENKLASPEAKVASAEVNGMKVEPKIGGGASESGAGEESAPAWFKVLVFLGIGVWLLSKFRGKRASPSASGSQAS
jgi:hypothetical protein